MRAKGRPLKRIVKITFVIIALVGVVCQVRIRPAVEILSIHPEWLGVAAAVIGFQCDCF